jgi:transcription initiation factor IIE alpha subunit
MPSSADRFDEIDDDDDRPSPGTNAHRVLSFLESNADKAFTQTEIAEATDIPRGSVGPTLVRLRERDRVDHRGHYWRVSDHDTSVTVAAEHAGATAADREDASFDRDDWQEHASDSRE